MLADLFFFFFNDTATTEIYTLSLHDALPIFDGSSGSCSAYGRYSGSFQPVASLRICARMRRNSFDGIVRRAPPGLRRSEEHTSELQSRQYLVCRLLLEKKKEEQ